MIGTGNQFRAQGGFSSDELAHSNPKALARARARLLKREAVLGFLAANPDFYAPLAKSLRAELGQLASLESQVALACRTGLRSGEAVRGLVASHLSANFDDPNLQKLLFKRFKIVGVSFDSCIGYSEVSSLQTGRPGPTDPPPAGRLP